MKIGLIVLGVMLLLIVGGSVLFFIMLAGPHVFQPPNRYAVAQDIALVVNGQTYTAHEESNCSVHDQRGSIAQGSSFHVDRDGEPLHVTLPGNSAVVVNGIDPCRWMEETPPVGLVTDLVPQDGPNIGWTKKLMGQAWYVDDLQSPNTARVMPLDALSTASGSWHLTDAKLTVIETAKPSNGSLVTALPFATGDKTNDDANLLVLVGATLSRYGCKGDPAPVTPGWVLVPSFPQCPGGSGRTKLRQAAVKVDDTFTRIDIDPETATPLVQRYGLFRLAINRRKSALGDVGHSYAGPTWATQICVAT